jgi:ribosomal 50S subunit-recycling heat shock protein
VTKIDMKTREVTVKTAEGEVSFVADERVKKPRQVKVGDTIHVVYTEAIAYEVKKGGKPTGIETQSAATTAKPGASPPPPPGTRSR